MQVCQLAFILQGPQPQMKILNTWIFFTRLFALLLRYSCQTLPSLPLLKRGPLCNPLLKDMMRRLYQVKMYQYARWEQAARYQANSEMVSCSLCAYIDTISLRRQSLEHLSTFQTMATSFLMLVREHGGNSCASTERTHRRLPVYGRCCVSSGAYS